jgi:flagellar hook protein FlgE
MALTTQYNSPTARTAQYQDGYATGQISSLTIDESGVMFANFSNQQTKAIGQVAVASFANEQGLQPIGGTRWKETFASGVAGLMHRKPVPWAQWFPTPWKSPTST